MYVKKCINIKVTLILFYLVNETNEAQLGPTVSIMNPILRFLQLLCENHNSKLQVNIYKSFNLNVH